VAPFFSDISIIFKVHFDNWLAVHFYLKWRWLL